MKTLCIIPSVGTLKQRALLAGAIASAVALLGGSASASTISEIEAVASGTAVTLDSAVVSAILSQPGTYGGRNFYNYSFLVQDATGSIDIYGVTNTAVGYTPQLGDAITASGTFSPYHQIPEIGTVTSISASAFGQPITPPSIYTIPDLNVATLPQSIAGYLVQVKNVGIYADAGGTTPASGLFPTANTSYYIKDGDGNIMMLYYWYTSYSTDAAMAGTAIPTGLVDITGFMSVYNSVAEFTPISITMVPEPSSVALAGLGLLGLLAARRRQR